MMNKNELLVIIIWVVFNVIYIPIFSFLLYKKLKKILIGDKNNPKIPELDKKTKAKTIFWLRFATIISFLFYELFCTYVVWKNILF